MHIVKFPYSCKCPIGPVSEHFVLFGQSRELSFWLYLQCDQRLFGKMVFILSVYMCACRRQRTTLSVILRQTTCLLWVLEPINQAGLVGQGVCTSPAMRLQGHVIMPAGLLLLFLLSQFAFWGCVCMSTYVNTHVEIWGWCQDHESLLP